MTLASTAASIACLAGIVAAGNGFAQTAGEDCVALSGVDAAKVRNIRVMSAIPQDDIRKHTMPMISVHVRPPAGYGGAGIVGAVIGGLIVESIINADVKKKAEQATLALPSLVEQVKDFDFRREFWSRLEASLAGETRFNVLDISVFDSERRYVEQPETVGGEPVDAVLDLRTEYALSPDLRSFMIVTHVLLQSRPDNRELYRCRYYFITPPVAAEAFAPAVAAWSADGAALYRAAAVIGMQQTLKMLRFDLLAVDAPRPSGAQVQVQAIVISPGMVGRAPVSSRLVEREDGALIARDDRGVMRSAVEGETFAPSAEAIAAAQTSGPRGGRGRSAPVGLDDLLGVLDEEKPGAPAKTAAPTPEKKPDASTKDAPAPSAKAERPSSLEDLGGLLQE